MSVGSIVLAAGASTRMGQQKLLLPFAGTTVVAHVARELLAAEVAAVHVVVGYEPQRIRAALADSRVVVVDNPDFETGMLSSIRAGLASAPAEWTAALIAPGDQPLIRAGHASALIGAHLAEPANMFVAGHEGRRGHPLLLPRRYWAEVAEGYDETGLRGLLQTHGDRLRVIELGTEDVLIDIDTPRDYERAVARDGDRRRVD